MKQKNSSYVMGSPYSEERNLSIFTKGCFDGMGNVPFIKNIKDFPQLHNHVVPRRNFITHLSRNISSYEAK